MMNSLVGSLYSSALAPIAQRLGTSPDDAGKLLDQAPITADAAKQDKLVDTVLPLTTRFGHFPGPHASLARYIADAPAPPADAPKVALIVASGEVAAPEASGQPNKIEPKRLAAELRDAAKDDSVKAIVLRMDTPGGTVTGSALVGAEVAAAASRKPLIVTMGGLDASGGYWISSHATRLLADPATLTGSIGVLGGKLSFGTLLATVGVNVTGATKGANALFDSPTTPWSKDQLSRLQTLLNANYQQFVNWVAAGRHMSPAQVNTVGQGRVWTGAQARSRGLVDEIGGYNAAFAAVRMALGLGEHAPLDIVDGNQAPGPRALLSLVARQASPLGLADLPAPLRDLLGAASSGARGRTQAIRAEMPPLTLR
jgi:protease-4